METRDPSLDTLLDLNGVTMVISDSSYWVKFVVREVPVSREKPHGLDYSLTLHEPNGARIAGFDNAHSVGGQKRGEALDHQHRLQIVRPYDYQDAATLLTDFWKLVSTVLKERGVQP